DEVPVAEEPRRATFENSVPEEPAAQTTGLPQTVEPEIVAKPEVLNGADHEIADEGAVSPSVESNGPIEIDPEPSDLVEPFGVEDAGSAPNLLPEVVGKPVGDATTTTPEPLVQPDMDDEPNYL